MKYIVTIRNHKYLGDLLIPYMVDKAPGMEFYTIKESLAPSNIATAPQLYTQAQIQIAQIADQYSDTQLRKKFGPKYSNNNDFFAKIGAETISTHIMPTIYSMMSQIVEICIANNIKIYYKSENMNSIFPSDEIAISSRKMKAVFNFERTNTETKYYLSLKYGTQDISLYQMQYGVLSYSPCIIISNKQLFRIENTDAKKLEPFVSKKYISVSKNVEQTYYEKFVKSVIETDAEIRATGFKITNTKTQPRPTLTVEQDLAGNTIFKLTFKYGNLEFHPQSTNKTVVRLITSEQNEYTFLKTTRDTQYETQIEQQAAQILGGRISSGYYKVSARYNDPLTQRATAINTLNTKKEQLTQAGIEIQLSDDDKKYYTGTIKLNFSITQQEDWFDIYATVRLDGMEIPFVALKYYILNNIREFVLPDSQIVVLPEEWFEKYQEILSSGTIHKKENIIQLRPYQYTALSKLPLEADMQQKIQRLQQQLSDTKLWPNTQPKNVNATLRPYQVTAFNWLKMMRDYGFGACLADDMGLGKTLCTLSLLSESTAIDTGEFQDGLYTFQKKTPSLLIVPKSLIYNWVNEAHKFVPQLKILEFTGSNRQETIKSFPLYDIIIAGYATLRNDAEILAQQQFHYIILDESQYVKNSASKTYQSIMMLQCHHRLALTGTPLENSLTDLWSQINFINPGLLGTLPAFKKKYVNPIEKNANEEAANKIKNIIYPFILRRTKQQVLHELPELMELTVLCNMTDQQKEIYEKEKSSTRNSILNYMDKGTFEKSTVMVLQSLTKLRQIACSPSLTQQNYDGGSGKTDTIINSLQNITAQGHKVLVFSSFVKHLELIAQRLSQIQIGYTMLTGTTENREDEVQKFNTQNTPVFLISIKAGGTGLNLTQASYVFITDPWWNPAVENQAIARAHRMGQKNAVMVYRFISKDTVEEKIQQHQRRKADLASAFVAQTNNIELHLKDEVLKILE